MSSKLPANDDLEKAKRGPRSIYQSLFKNKDYETYRSGYPQFSYLVGETPELQNFRRFRRARARLLLVKQDRIAQLEDQLDKIDNDEQSELFLGNMRRDTNEERKKLLTELDEALADYDGLLSRSEWAMNMPWPRKDAVDAIRKWRSSTGSIARAETAYMDFPRFELLSIGDRGHLAYTRLERWLEKLFELALRIKSKIIKDHKKNEFHAVAVHRQFVREASRVFIATFAVLLLLAPIVGLNAVQRTVSKFAIIFVAAVVFVLSISILSRAAIGEVFAAGAAYAAVLVVFVSGNGIQPTNQQTSP